MTEIDEDKSTGDATKDARTGDQKSRDKKAKKKYATKVIIRRLPPSMTEDVFVQQIEPMPDHDYFYFVPADWSLGQFATSRAYINFSEPDDVFLFKDKFDGYVFVDTKGVEYPAIVEFAPLQSLPKNKSRKMDNKSGTIEEDPLYQSFLAALTNEETDPAKPEMKMEYSYQIKDDKKVTSTPLLEFLALKKEERRRKKVEDKKKVREEEKNRKKDIALKGEIDDKKRKDNGKYRNKKDGNRTMPLMIPEEDDDGIVVRTVKSRIMDNIDRWKNAKDDREADRGDRNNSNDQNDPKKNGRDRRKDRKNRRNDRDGKKIAEPEEFRILRPEKPEKSDVLESTSTPNPIEQASAVLKRPLDKPKDEKVKKYSESRRERRASMRNQSEKAADSLDTKFDGSKPKKENQRDGADNKTSESTNKKPKNVEQQDGRRSSMESNGDGDNRPDSATAKVERELARIRKKDRPSLQIYQPGRRRTSNGDNPAEKNRSGQSSPTEKLSVKLELETPNNTTDPSDSKPKPDKRVSRYSERRNKNKEVQRKPQAGDTYSDSLVSRDSGKLGDGEAAK